MSSLPISFLNELNFFRLSRIDEGENECFLIVDKTNKPEWVDDMLEVNVKEMRRDLSS